MRDSTVLERIDLSTNEIIELHNQFVDLTKDEPSCWAEFLSIKRDAQYIIERHNIIINDHEYLINLLKTFIEKIEDFESTIRPQPVFKATEE